MLLHVPLLAVHSVTSRSKLETGHSVVFIAQKLAYATNSGFPPTLKNHLLKILPGTGNTQNIPGEFCSFVVPESKEVLKRRRRKKTPQ